MDQKKKLSGWQNKLKRRKKQAKVFKKQKTLHNFLQTVVENEIKYEHQNPKRE